MNNKNPDITRYIWKLGPKCVVWELTLGCNLHCWHCGASAGEARKNELTTEEALDLCEELAKIRTEAISLMGGEPFLRKDIFQIAQKIKDLDLKLYIITNGMLIDEKLVKMLVDLKPNSIGLSLDGGTAEVHDEIRGNGTFKKAMEALNMLVAAGLHCTVITALNKTNVYELPKIRDLLLKRGIGWQIQMCSGHGERFHEGFMLSQEEFYWAASFIAETRSKYSLKEMPITGGDDFGYFSNCLPLVSLATDYWRGCFAGIRSLGITSDGGIKGCLSLPDEFLEGNIRNRKLSEIWNDPDSFAYNRRFEKEHLQGFCKTCEHGETCRGGCSDIAYSLTGSLHDNPLCLYRIETEKQCLTV
ncbi:radical SAM protein [Candidatus Margulisiibacteriota bacterium]